MTCIYIHFLKKLQAKILQLRENNSFRIFFFQVFCFMCFEISEYFKNIYFTEHLPVNVC